MATVLCKLSLECSSPRPLSNGSPFIRSAHHPSFTAFPVVLLSHDMLLSTEQFITTLTHQQDKPAVRSRRQGKCSEEPGQPRRIKTMFVKFNEWENADSSALAEIEAQPSSAKHSSAQQFCSKCGASVVSHDAHNVIDLVSQGM